MLERIHIQNFRSCQNVSLEGLGYLTALVGRNGSGKTNILRAIDWLARAATETDLTRRLWQQAFAAPSMTAVLELNGTFYRYSLGLTTDKVSVEHTSYAGLTLTESLEMKTHGSRWKPLFRRTGTEVEVHTRDRILPIRLGPVAPCLPGLTALRPDEELLEKVHPLLSFLSATRYYPVDETNLPQSDALSMVSSAAYQNWLRQSQTAEPQDDSVLLRLLDVYLQNRSVFDEIRSLLGADGLDLLDDITVKEGRVESPGARRGIEDAGPDFYVIQFHPGGALGKGSDRFAYGDLSLGTRRIVHIVTSLLVDESALLLLEHPEDGIHPGLLWKLMGLLKANVNPAQIILSSHSPQVLNALTPHDVRLVSIHRGATRARGLTEREVVVAKRFLDEEGPLADFVETVEE
jgi:ABC-type branched-subunit amino acid transport system ATPase component